MVWALVVLAGIPSEQACRWASTHEIRECQHMMMPQLLWHRAPPEQIQETRKEKMTPRQHYQKALQQQPVHAATGQEHFATCL